MTKLRLEPKKLCKIKVAEIPEKQLNSELHWLHSAAEQIIIIILITGGSTGFFI